MKKVLKIILAIVLFIFIGIQFYQPALNVDKGQVYTTDFTQAYKMPVQVKAMFQTSCYDCHSYESISRKSHQKRKRGFEFQRMGYILK